MNSKRDGVARSVQTRLAHHANAIHPRASLSRRGMAFSILLYAPGKQGGDVSQIIASTVETGKIKIGDPTQTSTRYRNYVPFWT